MIYAMSETYNSLVDKASKFLPLKNLIDDLWIASRSELEFEARFKKQISEFTQYTIADVELLSDEITVNRENFNLFWETLEDLRGELESIKPEMKHGRILTQKNGRTHSFEYEYYYSFLIHLNAPGYVFRIFEKGRENEDSFSFQLREMENGTELKVVDLYPDHSNYYLGKGISIAIILETKNIFNRNIISSSNLYPSHSGEWNSEQAIEKVWNRLLVAGVAKYYKEFDYYAIEFD